MWFARFDADRGAVLFAKKPLCSGLLNRLETRDIQRILGFLVDGKFIEKAEYKTKSIAIIEKTAG